MLSIKVRLAAASGFAVALAAAFTLTAGPALANVGPNCKNGTAAGTPVHVCVYLNGSSNGIINYLQGQGSNAGYVEIYALHIELVGPRGHILNCPQVNLPGGQIPPASTPVCQWSPFDLRAAGNYCAILWQHISGANYRNTGEACAYNP